MSSLIGVGLSLLVAISKSASAIVSKRNLNTDIDPYVNAWALRTFALPLIFIALALDGIPSIEPEFYKALAVSGPIGVISTVLYMKGLQKSDISIISPLSALSPLLLLLTAPLIVGEFPSVIGLIGVMVTTVGVYLLELSKKHKSVFAPLKAIAKEPGAKYIVAMLLLYSISSPVDKLGVEASSPIMYTAGLYIVIFCGLTPLAYFKGTTPMDSLTRTDLSSLGIIGILTGLYAIGQMMALTFTLVIYVIAIKRAGILFSVAAGGIFFDEPYTRERFIGSIVIFIGLIIITISLA